MATIYASARPVVTVQNPGGNAGSASLPAVFLSPIRNDLVRFVHTNMNKNNRQAYAVSTDAGHQTAAVSWGTGRAVSRIPRVPGSGTSRSGQGAFGNMCRGGRMFAPTRQWRRWHRKINKNQKRYAVASALAASALPSLVMARGHRIEQVAEVPLVVADSALQGVKKTKDAIKLLQGLNASADLAKVKDSKTIRPGRGKSRNRRYVMRKGPLLVHSGTGDYLRGLRNIPGVEFCEVGRLNLLKLAPGGHLGRFIIWTESAFNALNDLFGDGVSASKVKKGFVLPRPVISNADIGRIINSDEVQSVVRPKREPRRRKSRHVNPLHKPQRMAALNPYYTTENRLRIRADEKRKANKDKKAADKPKEKKRKVSSFAKMMHNPL